MAIRLNTEKTIDNETFKLKIGTTNKINPQVIYVEGKAFVSPQIDKENYSKDISEIKHSFNKVIGNKIKEYGLFENKFILDFQIALSGIKAYKKSFLSFQFLLKQNRENVLQLKDIKTSSNPMINDIVYSLKDNLLEHHYTITKTKK